MPLLPRLRNILVAVVVRMPCPLVLEVLFVVVRLVILPSCRLSSSQRGRVFPQELIHQQLLLHSVDVHVGNRGKVRLGNLSSSYSPPVSFHSLHVPLVHYCNDVLGFEGPQLPEDALVSEIDEDLLLLGRALAQQGHQEVDSASIHRLSKRLSSSCVENIMEVIVLRSPR